MVSDIAENTTTDARGLLWTCQLSFDIPTRGPSGHQQHIMWMGREMPNMRAAQFDAMLLCLQALQRICYTVPDYSSFKISALRAGNLPIPQVSELMASYNHMDVVKY